MPYDRSAKVKRVMSSSAKKRNDSDDDFEDVNDDIDSTEFISDSNMIEEREDDERTNISDEESTRPTRRCRKSAKRFLSKLNNSEDESESNEELSELSVDPSNEEHTQVDNSVLVTYRDDLISNIRCGSLLYRQTLPISSWIPILEKMNTHYVKHGSIIHPSRFSEWKALSPEQQNTSVELYLVKWKSLSFVHCCWEAETDLINHDGPHMKQKFLRFLRTENDILTEITGYGIDSYFNPDYVEVDRVLDVRIIQEDTSLPIIYANNSDLESLLVEEEYGKKGIFVKEFLVKWKGLPYCDVTWEVFEDLDNKESVEEYYSHLKRDITQNIYESDYRPPLTLYKKIGSNMKYKNGNQLRSYQIDGINWLLWNWVNGRNSILADEMGLGKTVQSTMFIFNILYRYMLKPPFLVVAPLSTIPHWEAEIRRWTDMHVVVLHGSVESRKMIRQYEWKSALGEFDVLITTFEIAMVEANLLSSISWAGVIVDEAHRLKGKNNKLGDVLRRIDFGCKLLLTGTPLQNNTEELWTLLNFLQPEKFDDADQFQDNFGDMKDSTQLEKLHDVLKPYMLRRMKEDVEKSLKPKEEIVINVEMTAMQKTFYRAVFDHNTSVFVGTDSKNLPSLMNVMMELRKCCNHPFLIRGVESTVIGESYTNEQKPKSKVIPQTIQELPPESALKLILNTCGKMVLLDKLLPKLKSQGHKVLLFSQMVRMLDIIQDYLAIKGYSFERIDGGVKVSDRQAAIERFSAPGSDRFIFLICTRAGGFGINLTAADTVIIYDSDWNPQNDIQAQARCHRIGQDKAVNVYRLITNNSYEMQMFQRANLKLGLDKAVLNPLKQSITSDGSVEMSRMTKKDAETLLKYGAYDIFKEEREGKSEELSNAFCEADIDQILEKNTKVITIDSQGGSSFSKASFITESSAEVDINDPDFWTKMGLKVQQQEDIGPRHRKRVDYHNVGDEDTIAGNEAGFEDENEWIKTDRDVLVKLLLSYGWGHWEPIYENERMKKHVRSSIRVLSASIIGQLARLTQIMEEDSDIKKINESAVRSAQHGKEAIYALEKTYSICYALRVNSEEAQEGKENAVGFPHRYPDLVRDTAWLNKMGRVCSRYLKHFSFMYNLHKDIETFKISLGAPVHLPKPRRAVKPASWWGEEEDRDCLLGTDIHGWGNWKEICDDPLLCFNQKGVIYNSQTTEEEDNLMEVENEQEAPEGENTVSSTTTDHSKVFPSTTILMKRIRRLVDAMEHSISKGMQSTTLDFLLTSHPSTPKRQKKSSMIFIGEWEVKESKALRNAILQWGLPIPPVKLADDQLFSMSHVPLYTNTKDKEKQNAVICDVVDELIKEVSLRLDAGSSDHHAALPTTPQSSRKVASPYRYHRCPICCATRSPLNRVSYCIFCDCYVAYRVLKLEGGLMHKSYEDTLFLSRYIEENAVRIAETPGKGNGKATTSEEEKGKGPGDVEVIIPSAVLAQRIHSRLQLYYDLQQLVWIKKPDLLKFFIQQWSVSGGHQETLSRGWVSTIHDVALLEGLYTWGVVEWEIIWKDPDLPFYIDETEETKKKRPRRRTRKSKQEENADAVPENPPEVTPEVETPPPEEVTRPKYTYEDALKSKSSLVKKENIVAGLPSLYVLKRINTIIRYLKQYNSFVVVTNINKTPSESALLVRNQRCRVRVVFQEKTLDTNLSVMFTEEVLWKKNQRVNRNAIYQLKSTPEGSVHNYPNHSDTWIHRLSDHTQPQQYHSAFLQQVPCYPYMPVYQSPPHLSYVPRSVAVRQPTRDNTQYLRASRHFLGTVRIPFTINGVTVQSLGRIVVKWKTYHDNEYIWPVNFRSFRMYTSFKDPTKTVKYVSEILEDGPVGPSFRVTAEDAPDRPCVSRSPDSSWKMVLERINIAKKSAGITEFTTTINGFDCFGLSYPEVAYCIEGLDCANLCQEYVCRKLRDHEKALQAPHTAPVDGPVFYPQFPMKRDLIFNTNLYNDKRMNNYNVCDPIQILLIL